MAIVTKSPGARLVTPYLRVITDNDYSGDPDGLVQLVHLLLSPSVEVRAVIGSHLGAGGPFNTSGRSAAEAKAQADEIVGLLGLTGRITTLQGSNSPLPDRSTPIRSAGAEAIVEEAMRDSDLPLCVTLGGGLTELASAYLMEPRIATRLTAIWIGGPEHQGITLSPPDSSEESEHNTRIDIAAAQVVFDSTIPLWQVPRDVYRQAFISYSELKARMRPCGAIGAHLFACLERSFDYAARLGTGARRSVHPGRQPAGSSHRAPVTVLAGSVVEPLRDPSGSSSRRSRSIPTRTGWAADQGVHPHRHPAHVRGYVRKAR